MISGDDKRGYRNEVRQSAADEPPDEAPMRSKSGPDDGLMIPFRAIIVLFHLICGIHASSRMMLQSRAGEAF